MISTNRQWLYHKDGRKRIFEAGEDVTGAWYDTPNFKSPLANLIGDVDHEELGDHDDEQTDQEQDSQKYPSQMNKTELVDFGNGIGLELDMEMSKREMLRSINESMKTGGTE